MAAPLKSLDDMEAEAIAMARRRDAASKAKNYLNKNN